MFMGDTQSLAWSAWLFSTEWNGMEGKTKRHLWNKTMFTGVSQSLASSP
jgi:hypothetical protein